MGYAFGLNYRREEIGYGVEATCTQDGCFKEIDKGLYFTCGGMEGVDGQRGCGRHFCGDHLVYVTSQLERQQGDDYDPEDEDSERAAVCEHCAALEKKGHETGMADESWKSQTS
jgi:hypothetical protein